MMLVAVMDYPDVTSLEEALAFTFSTKILKSTDLPCLPKQKRR
jgi:hypothetical protein